MLTFDIALWLRSSSPLPEITERREVDPSMTALDAVFALMQERRETYVFKAGVKTPYGLEWFSRLTLSFNVPTCQVSALDIVKALWPLLEAASLDPVEVRSSDALGQVRTYASRDPDSLFAIWCRSALAVDERLFSDFWNSRRSAVVRCRLSSPQESEVSYEHS